MNKRNYQKELDKILKKSEKMVSVSGECVQKEIEPGHLLLHSCCAPCSSYVLEYLSRYFRITVLYYNPNITASAEYFKRVEEQKRLIEIFNSQEGRFHIDCIEGDYAPKQFLELTKGMEECPEGGERCFLCYRMRLEESARVAGEIHADYFTTTLTISPLKNAQKLNEIGEELAAVYGVPWLPSDFKKKEGYKRSVELSAEYGLYRQDYCGCAYSKAERERQKDAKKKQKKWLFMVVFLCKIGYIYILCSSMQAEDDKIMRSGLKVNFHSTDLVQYHKQVCDMHGKEKYEKDS